MHRRRGARRSCSPPACTPSSAASRRSDAASRRARRARSSARCGGSRGSSRSSPSPPAPRSCRSACSRPELSSRTRSPSRSACSSPTCPKGCCRRSRSRWPSGVRELARQRRARQAAQRRRDARVDERHLHRQDRHADREPHARSRSSGPRPASSTSRGGRATATPARHRGWRDRPRCRACNNAELAPDERAHAATRPRSRCSRPPGALGADIDRAAPRARRLRLFHFDPKLRLMSTVDDDGAGRSSSTPRALPRRCSRSARASRPRRPHVGARRRDARADRAASWTMRRAGACACSRSPTRLAAPSRRYASASDAERGLTLLGLVALFDPPRPEVADAVARCHTRRHPDHRRHRRPRPDGGRDRAPGRHRPRRDPRSSRATTSTRSTEAELDRLLRARAELIFARASPETKLRIADALQRAGPRRRDDRRRRQRRPRAAARRHRRRDGPLGHRRRSRGRHDGAHRRQLRDDRDGDRGGPPRLRQRPQVRPLHLRPRHAGGRAVPRLRARPAARSRCRSPSLQILAIDLGTETLPALALGRRAAEPGLMDGRPRAAQRRHHQPGAARARLGVPRPDLGRAGARRLLPRAARAPAGVRATRPAAARRCTTPTSGHDHDVPRHRGLPGRNRLRGAHRPRLPARVGVFTNRLLLCGHRVRDRVRRGPHLRAGGGRRLRRRLPRRPPTCSCCPPSR